MFSRLGSKNRLHDAPIAFSYVASMESFNVCTTIKKIDLELKLSCKVVSRMMQLWMASGVLHVREMEVFAERWLSLHWKDQDIILQADI